VGADRAGRALRVALHRRADRVTAQAKLLEAVSYRSVLHRGFALVRDARGAPLRRAAEVSRGATIEIEFADGVVNAAAAGAPRRRRTAREPGDEQGSLGL
jgi:exodeoxyribonuclease VII large subunit